MEQFKRAKVIMLPTDTKSLLHINYSKLHLNKFEQLDVNNQHLYIISDDEIKDGDWWFNLDNNTTHRGELYKVANNTPSCKKIIATTDTSLEIVSKGINPVYEKLPQPSQQFIEKYIESYNKGEVISDVLVEYELNIKHNGRINNETKMYETLKINPKDNTITIKKLKDDFNYEERIQQLESQLSSSMKLCRKLLSYTLNEDNLEKEFKEFDDLEREININHER